jgi:hypothetical protein
VKLKKLKCLAYQTKLFKSCFRRHFRCLACKPTAFLGRPGVSRNTEDTNAIASANRVLYGSATATGAPAETMFIGMPQSDFGLTSATLVGGLDMGIESSSNVEMTKVNAASKNVIKLSKGHVCSRQPRLSRN